MEPLHGPLAVSSARLHVVQFGRLYGASYNHGNQRPRDADHRYSRALSGRHEWGRNPRSGRLQRREAVLQRHQFHVALRTGSICCDQLVQTVYFPTITLPLACNVPGCAQAESDFFLLSPGTVPRARPRVCGHGDDSNSGVFVNTNNACRTSTPTFNAVSGASFAGPNLAADSIATALGDQLVPITSNPPLPHLPPRSPGFR